MAVAPDILAGCEQEPIHLPGSIQPHGVLLVLSPPDLRLVQASANAGDGRAAGGPRPEAGGAAARRRGAGRGSRGAAAA